jgi:hypothetical protein
MKSAPSRFRNSVPKPDPNTGSVAGLARLLSLSDVLEIVELAGFIRLAFRDAAIVLAHGRPHATARCKPSPGASCSNLTAISVTTFLVPASHAGSRRSTIPTTSATKRGAESGGASVIARSLIPSYPQLCGVPGDPPFEGHLTGACDSRTGAAPMPHNGNNAAATSTTPPATYSGAL